MDWVKVCKGNLPPEMAPVIVTVSENENGATVKKTRIGRLNGNIWELLPFGGPWCYPDADVTKWRMCVHEEVTHWMHFPLAAED